MRTLRLLCQGYSTSGNAELITYVNGAKIFKGAVPTSPSNPPQIPVRIDNPYSEFTIPVDFEGAIQIKAEILSGTIILGDVLANYVRQSDPVGFFGSLPNPVADHRYDNPYEINVNKIRTVDNIIVNGIPVVQEFKHNIDNGVSLKDEVKHSSYTPADIVMNGWPDGRRPIWLETVHAGDIIVYTINVFLASWHQKSPVDQ